MHSALNKDKLPMSIVYPFGCTLSVTKPSVVAFSSGSTTFPVDRPLGGMYYNETTGNKSGETCSKHLK